MKTLLRFVLPEESRLQSGKLVCGEIEVDPVAHGAGAELALHRLLEGAVGEGELAAAVIAAEGYGGMRQLYGLLFELHRERLLRRSVSDRQGRLLASAVPLVEESPFSVEGPPEGRFRLSRFAYLRRRGDAMALESPVGRYRIHLHDEGVAAFLARLARPASVADLAEEGVAGLRGDAAPGLCHLLALGDFLTAEDGESTAEDSRRPLAQWTFHDLLFHSRSRRGRHDASYGSTFHQRERWPSLPALKPPPGASADLDLVDLPAPSLEHLASEDPSLTSVLENRRSRRQHGEPALSLDDLGEILWRAARAEPPVPGNAYEVARRVYPGGGGAWELEIYPLVQRCSGLEPGLYHYRPAEHRLARLADPGPATERLLASAARAAHVEDLQVLLTFTARFGRLFWKYSSMAYATVLKDVGVLLQTLYLSAEAMGLSACAIGGGDSDLFAEAAALDYYEEGAVGEMILGRG